MIHQATAHVGETSIVIETGKLAKLADGAVTVRCGDTILLVSAVSATTIKEGQDWFPLTVDYREKSSAVGRFPGGYFKREGRPTEKEILTCRMTDRPLRPLFPKGYLYDTQIIAMLMSADGENDPDMLCINGASAALCVSDIPWAGPVGAVRVGRVDGKFVANPTHSQRAHSDLDLVYVGNATDMVMIEGAALEIPEDDFIEALKFGQAPSSRSSPRRRNSPRKSRRQARRPRSFSVQRRAARSRLPGGRRSHRGRHLHAAQRPIAPRRSARSRTKSPPRSSRSSRPPGNSRSRQAFDYLQKKAFRTSILDKQKRADGRGYFDLRPLHGEVGLLPRAHGSALFRAARPRRSPSPRSAPLKDAQDLDGYTGGETSKSFILHYNFPPFSVGETGRTSGPGRREIGHGALAERSLAAVIPPEADFPYALRVSSEIMESNGSTSMASVCGGCLALMDAGVPINAPVAGISVRPRHRVRRRTASIARYTTLTDIIGSEDHFGDMDFKLCGTAKGITGFQLDLKLTGISLELMAKAIHQATRRAHENPRRHARRRWPRRARR